MKEDRHILYEDEDGEVQVHEPMDLSSSEEEGRDEIEIKPPVVLDKVVVGMKHQIQKLEQEMAHVKAAKGMIQEEDVEKEKGTRYYPPNSRRRLMPKLQTLMRLWDSRRRLRRTLSIGSIQRILMVLEQSRWTTRQPWQLKERKEKLGSKQFRTRWDPLWKKE